MTVYLVGSQVRFVVWLLAGWLGDETLIFNLVFRPISLGRYARRCAA